LLILSSLGRWPIMAKHHRHIHSHCASVYVSFSAIFENSFLCVVHNAPLGSFALAG